MVCPPYQEGPGHAFARNEERKLRKQQKAPHINQGKGATWEEKPLHRICFTAFLDTCFLVFLLTLFAVWLASDFVPTLNELKL